MDIYEWCGPVCEPSLSHIPSLLSSLELPAPSEHPHKGCSVVFSFSQLPTGNHTHFCVSKLFLLLNCLLHQSLMNSSVSSVVYKIKIRRVMLTVFLQLFIIFCQLFNCWWLLCASKVCYYCVVLWKHGSWCILFQLLLEFFRQLLEQKKHARFVN